MYKQVAGQVNNHNEIGRRRAHCLEICTGTHANDFLNMLSLIQATYYICKDNPSVDINH
jgi:hypothetical protein